MMDLMDLITNKKCIIVIMLPSPKSYVAKFKTKNIKIKTWNNINNLQLLYFS